MKNLLQSLTGMKKTTVGLDLGTYSIKLVRVHHNKNGEDFLEAAGMEELEPGTISQGKIKNTESFIDSVNTLVSRIDPGIEDVAISVTNKGTLLDRTTIKVEPGEDPEDTVLMKARQHSPFDADDISLDFRILSRDEDKGEVDVLIVAAKNQVMQKYIDTLYEAGLRPVLVDVESFALNNAYSLESQEETEYESVVLLDIGHESSSVTYIKEGIYQASRDFNTAGENFLKVLQRNLGVSPEDAFNLLRGAKEFVSKKVDDTMVKQAVEYAIEDLLEDLKMALSYFKGGGGSSGIEKVVLSGGGAYIPGLPDMLEDGLELPVQLSNPLNYIQYDPELFQDIRTEDVAGFFSVALGLALRRVDYK